MGRAARLRLAIWYCMVLLHLGNDAHGPCMVIQHLYIGSNYIWYIQFRLFRRCCFKSEGLRQGSDPLIHWYGMIRLCPKLWPVYLGRLRTNYLLNSHLIVLPWGLVFFPLNFRTAWICGPHPPNIIILWSIQLPADKFVFGNRWGAVVAHLVANPEAKHGWGNPFGKWSANGQCPTSNC